MRQAPRLGWYSIVSGLFLCLWQLATLLEAPRATVIVLAINGFVFHIIFGKAYALIPSYFSRELSFSRAPFIQLPLVVIGTIVLAMAPLEPAPAVFEAIGASLWFLGVGIFLVTIGWTVRDNLAGAETGTAKHNRDRKRLDRLSNAFIPVALAYLLVGSYAMLANATGLASMFGGIRAPITHVLATGTAGLMVIAIGARLLPRFFVASPIDGLITIALITGATGPILLALGFPVGPAFQAGGLLVTIALLAYAGTVAVLVKRTDRWRVGFYGVCAGAIAGVMGVLLGLEFAFRGINPELVALHIRVNLLGFLGLTIVGVAFQFYPPNVAPAAWIDDRLGMLVIGLLAGGLLVEAVGVLLGVPGGVRVGQLASLFGAIGYATIIVGVFQR